MARSIEAEYELDLVQRCLADDEQACRELYQRFLPQVRGVLYRLLGPDPELEDLAQDAMLLLYRGICRFRGDARLHTWADRVCVNVALGHIRQRGRRLRTVPLPEEERPALDPRADAEQQAERARLVERVHQVMDEIAPVKRVAFLLHELGGLTAAEIAAASDCPVSTVKSRIWYARKELHRAAAEDPVLREYLGTSSADEDLPRGPAGRADTKRGAQ